MCKISAIGSLPLLLVLSVSQLWAQETGWGLHKRLFAVPVPGPVTIDGKLDDWDLSGQIEMYVVAATRQVQSAKFAVMYDADALYLGGEVRDPTPMMNRHSPEAEGNVAWDADACQFRMVLDPAQGYPVTDATWNKKVSASNDQLVHLLLWYFTDRKEPNLQMKTSMAYIDPPGVESFGVVPKNKFQAAYRMSDDKVGYTFEYRIPWSTLGAKNPPKGGDIVAGTMQVNWGRADGLKTAGLSGWGYDLMSFAGFAYQNAGCWGKVIFSKEGHLPKELVDEGIPPEKPLPLKFEYDLPEDGEVTVALFNSRNEVARALASQSPRLAGHIVEKWDGLDDVGRPLSPGVYTWRGLYHQPIKSKYLMSVHNSGQPAYKTDTGNGGWGADHGPPTGACALGNDMLLAWISSETGSGIIRTDSEGKKKWGSTHDAQFIATDGERIYAAGGQGFNVQTGVNMFDVKDCRPIPFGNGAAGLAPPVGENRNNTVTGLACLGDVVCVAFKERDLIAIYDSRQGNLKQTWNVPSPEAMAARKDGSLALISDGRLATVQDGKINSLSSDQVEQPGGIAVDSDGMIYVSNGGKLQNVSVFSAEGKYLRSIGKEGGRPRVGRFDPAGMLCPCGIAVDAKGRLWVAESIDSPKRFSVWNIKSGRLEKEFFGAAHYSSFIWMDPEHPDEVFCDGAIWKVDLDKMTWNAYSTLWRPTKENSPGEVATHFGGFKAFTANNGHQYGFSGDTHHGSVLYLREGDIFKPVLGFFWTGRRYPVFSDEKKYPDGTYVWVDKNDDQTIQEDELSQSIGPSYYRGFCWVDKDLNLYHGRGYVYRPLRIEPDGHPVYDFKKPEKLPIEPTFVDTENGSLYQMRPGEPLGTDIGYGCYRPDGILQWGYRGAVDWPKALSLPPQQPGKLWGPTAHLGIAGEFTGFNTYFGVFHIFTRDGLYVTMLFDDPRVGIGLNERVISTENGNGQLVKPKGMERYFALGGDQDGRITEVFGLDTVKRLNGGEYTISEEDVKKAAAANKAYQAKLAKTQRLIFVRGRKSLESSQPVTKIVNAQQSFKTQAAYDEKNLYVLFDVVSMSDLTNGIADPTVIFKGGNLIDIQIATDPQSDPGRKTPAPGDIRILASRKDEKPIAMIFRPKVKAFAGEPTVLRSPTGTESFDVIESSDKIVLDYKKTPSGFTATVTIPLEVIGMKLESGKKVMLDVGYIFGNPGGVQATLRSYWHNNGFSANVLNDVPNESRLEPAEWGLAEFE